MEPKEKKIRIYHKNDLDIPQFKERIGEGEFNFASDTYFRKSFLKKKLREENESPNIVEKMKNQAIEFLEDQVIALQADFAVINSGELEKVGYTKMEYKVYAEIYEEIPIGTGS
ncbi:MAG: hypothetical protein ABH828_01935 [archaeon]